MPTPGRRTPRRRRAPRRTARETTQRPAWEIYDSLATAARPRIAYVLPRAVRSHDGVPSAPDRDLVRPGGRHDPPVGVARCPRRALRRGGARCRRPALGRGEAPPGAPRLEVSAAAQADCDAWLEEKGWRERPLVLVQPGNRRTMRGRRLRLSAADDKAWPLERWGTLLHRLHARLPQALIVLCGAPRESLLLEWIAAAAAPLPAVVAAELPLPPLLAPCTP